MLPQSTDLYPPGGCPRIIMAMIPTVRLAICLIRTQATHDPLRMAQSSVFVNTYLSGSGASHKQGAIPA
jgi:hypothetical protein